MGRSEGNLGMLRKGIKRNHWPSLWAEGESSGLQVSGIMERPFMRWRTLQERKIWGGWETKNKSEAMCKRKAKDACAV